ncbi:hypothetical protein ACQKCO_00720 [Shewanella baltica]|uniref:hypothetical protein n=1 Tax=Shewanella baltica TaxID=62322 RepID=UPI003D04606B
MFISKKCPYCKGKLGAKEVPIKEGHCCHCEQPILYKLNIIKWMLLFMPIFTVSVNLLDKDVYGFWICFAVMAPIYSLVYLLCHEVVKCPETDGEVE